MTLTAASPVRIGSARLVRSGKMASNGLKIRGECHPWRLTVTGIKNASPNASGLGTVLNVLTPEKIDCENY